MSGSQPETPFYPPRAGRFSGLWYWWFHLKHVTFWQRAKPPEFLSDGQQLRSVLLPGYVFCAIGYGRIGLAILIGYGITALVSIEQIGLPLATICFGLMVSAHATSILQLMMFRAGTMNVLRRSGLAFLLIVATSIVFYLPIFQFIKTYVGTALITPNGAVVVNPRSSPEEVKLGDAVGFRILGYSGAGFRVEDGAGYGPVIGTEGDRIVFTSSHYEVNGVPRERLRRMPTKGEVTVAPGNWYVWQDVSFPSTILMRTAMVSKEQLIGKLYRRWFSRDQSHFFKTISPNHEPLL